MKRFRFLISVLFPPNSVESRHLPRGGALLAPGWVYFLVASSSFFFKEKKSGGFGSLSQ